jgi:tetratricopeptide (TPR) repeat protein
MIGKFLAGAALALILASGATAQPAAAVGEQDADTPVGRAKTLSIKALQAANAAGPAAMKPYVADLERSLASPEVLAGRLGSEASMVAFDTPEEASAYVQWMQSSEGQAKAPKLTLLFEDPYVLISFELGTYYNEVHSYDQALRALDEGMRLLRLRHDLERSGLAPTVINERGVALMGLKRWPEVLTACEGGLQISSLKPAARARLYRCRGEALTDLGRLDEAEQSYRTSLTYAPNNPIALNELRYIAGLRKGDKPTDTLITTPGFPPNT